MKKRGLAGFDEIPGWVIALLVLILVFGLYFVFNQKGSGILDYLRNLWRYN